MNYFDQDNHAQDYIKMSDGTDGRDLIPPLRRHLPDGSALLELGMGPGKDLDLLRAHYKVTGSDSAQAFIDIYLQAHPNSELLLLDAITMDTDRLFDGIYSNKALMHLSKEELQRSFLRQAQVLNPGGIAFHTFWRGEGEEEFDGLRFVYYQPETLIPYIGNSFEILETTIYKEFENDDSFYIILKKKG